MAAGCRQLHVNGVAALDVALSHDLDHKGLLCAQGTIEHGVAAQLLRQRNLHRQPASCQLHVLRPDTDADRRSICDL